MGFLAAAIPAIGISASDFAGVGIAASLLGGVTSAIGSVASAHAQQESAQYQAQVAANNQKLATQNAALASASGSEQVEQAGLKTKAQVGGIEAAQAASNINVDSGSALDVRSSAAELGELDALTIRSNAAKAAYGYDTAATAYGGQEALSKSQAAAAGVAGGLGATGSLLTGATGVTAQYANWQNLAGINSPSGSLTAEAGPAALWGS